MVSVLSMKDVANLHSRIEKLYVKTIGTPDYAGRSRCLLSNGDHAEVRGAYEGAYIGDIMHRAEVEPHEHKAGYKVMPWGEGSFDVDGNGERKKEDEAICQYDSEAETLSSRGEI